MLSQYRKKRKADDRKKMGGLTERERERERECVCVCVCVLKKSNNIS